MPDAHPPPTAPLPTSEAVPHARPSPVHRRSGPLADLLDLALPATCAACDDPGVILCSDCVRGWLTGHRRCEQDADRLDRLDGHGPLPVWTQATYQGAVRRTVLAWKDRGRLELTRWFAERTALTAAVIAPELAALLGSPPTPTPPPTLTPTPPPTPTPIPPSAPTRAGPAPGCLVPGPTARRRTSPHDPRLLVVPAPPSAAGRRRRGEDLLRPLATAAARGLSAAGIPAAPYPCLRLARAHRDQVGLGRAARGANIAGRIAVRGAGRGAPRSPSTAATPVLLVDDVLTTGATLAACRAALERAGHPVVGALTLAATPPPTHR
jgi:predicted amidophosphoribosyltransferase